MEDIPADAPRPRLCYVKKWPDFNGYGFNLHAERGKAGQFIGTIDDKSPAQTADLRAGDRIVEVNGTNIGSENHQQVVQRIKAVATETKLLVVDPEADAYYKERKIVVRGDMPIVDYHETPDVNPYTVSGINSSMEEVKVSPSPDYDTYKPRLCRLRMWSDFSGYGFNLHADRSKPGQFVGKVDEQSPAQAAGLQSADRIIEVNGKPVAGMSHGEVVAEIKSTPGDITLLVVDREVEEHYRSAGVEIRGSMPGILSITCPDDNPYTAAGEMRANGSAGEVEDARGSTHAQSFGYEHEADTTDDQRVPSPQFVGATEQAAEYDDAPAAAAADLPAPAEFTEPEPTHAAFELQEPPAAEPVAAEPVAPPPASTTASYPSSVDAAAGAATGKSVVVGGLEFAGSAKEARERMKKKGNVKQDANLSLKDKYDILQRL